VADKITFVPSDFSSLLAAMDRKAKGLQNIEIEIYHKATGDRSARKNAEIRSIQKRLYDRDPFFFSADEEQRITDAIHKAVGAPDRDTRLWEACKAAGQEMVREIKAHIDAGITKGGGRVPPIKRQWAIRKARKYGTNKPILRDTDQLYNSLVWRVRIV